MHLKSSRCVELVNGYFVRKAWPFPQAFFMSLHFSCRTKQARVSEQALSSAAAAAEAICWSRMILLVSVFKTALSDHASSQPDQKANACLPNDLLHDMPIQGKHIYQFWQKKEISADGFRQVLDLKAWPA